MADTRSIDLKLKRLRAIEAGCRSLIKRAEEEYKHNLIAREKLIKIRKKQEMKIEKLLPKVRKLQHIRNELRARS